ncbi:uncharacterized protein LOC115390772 isoform X2 [Salarias fasciatus]|uniref:uncharacterized protein LOC115390772 isoform X2 n=1 Tax=Salarias fasciatus TaxID=181472 RepID=UPI001176F862|nr:uncharacterized protein LOC115390772 isoform X2 [Salarias fasciatus]
MLWLFILTVALLTSGQQVTGPDQDVGEEEGHKVTYQCHTRTKRNLESDTLDSRGPQATERVQNSSEVQNITIRCDTRTGMNLEFVNIRRYNSISTKYEDVAIWDNNYLDTEGISVCISLDGLRSGVVKLIITSASASDFGLYRIYILLQNELVHWVDFNVTEYGLTDLTENIPSSISPLNGTVRPPAPDGTQPGMIFTIGCSCVGVAIFVFIIIFIGVKYKEKITGCLKRRNQRGDDVEMGPERERLSRPGDEPSSSGAEAQQLLDQGPQVKDSSS